MALCVFYDTNVLFLLGVFFLAFSACGVCVELEPLCCTRVSWRFEKMGLLFHSHGVFSLSISTFYLILFRLLFYIVAEVGFGWQTGCVHWLVNVW